MRQQPKPRYAHDCEKCVYLGQQGEADVYYCAQGAVKFPTIVMRHSDDGPDYFSAWSLVEDLPEPMADRARDLAQECDE